MPSNMDDINSNPNGATNNEVNQLYNNGRSSRSGRTDTQILESIEQQLSRLIQSGGNINNMSASNARNQFGRRGSTFYQDLSNGRINRVGRNGNYRDFQNAFEKELFDGLLGKEFRNSLESIRLSPNKAKILANELLLLKEYMKEKKVDPNRAFGVNSGLGAEVPYIGFSSLNDDERTIVVTIGRIDNSGNIISSQTFNFNSKDYWYALEWEDITNMKVERAAYNQLELDMFIDTLDSFAKNMNGALAYSVLDLARYDAMRINRKFDSIFDKLGIEKYTPGSNKGSYGSNNFLNNLSANNRSSNSTSLDSLEDMLDD